MIIVSLYIISVYTEEIKILEHYVYKKRAVREIYPWPRQVRIEASNKIPLEMCFRVQVLSTLL